MSHSLNSSSPDHSEARLFTRINHVPDIHFNQSNGHFNNHSNDEIHNDHSIDQSNGQSNQIPKAARPRTSLSSSMRRATAPIDRPVTSTNRAVKSSSNQSSSQPTRRSSATRTSSQSNNPTSNQINQINETLACSSPAAWLAYAQHLKQKCQRLEREASLTPKIRPWLVEISHSINPPKNQPTKQSNQTVHQSLNQCVDHLLALEKSERERDQSIRRESESVLTALNAFQPRIATLQSLVASMHNDPIDSSNNQSNNQAIKARRARITKEVVVQMDDIEDRIAQFRSSQSDRYNKLENEVIDLTRQCEITETRVKQWEIDLRKPINQTDQSINQTTSQPVKPSVKAIQQSTALPPELLELDREIETAGGSTGGWPAEDQTIFVSLFYSSPTDSKLIASLIERLTYRTVDECRAHLAWWRRYLRWQEERKFIIAQYKQQKQEIHQREEEERFKQAAAINQSINQSIEAIRIAEIQERDEKLAQVAAWRQQREQQQSISQSINQNEREKAEKRARLKREEEQRRRKLELEAARAARVSQQLEIHAQQVTLQAEEKERTAVIKAAQKRAIEMKHHQSLNAIREKRASEEALRVAAEQQKVRLVEQSRAVVGVRAERDPARLMGHTTSASARAAEAEEKTKQRQEAKKIGKSAQLAMTAYNPGHRATPTWRQGL